MKIFTWIMLAVTGVFLFTGNPWLALGSFAVMCYGILQIKALKSLKMPTDIAPLSWGADGLLDI